MNVAVRYYSRSGNTKAIAEAIARKAKVEAISVDSESSKIDEIADVLFVGGALYAYGIDEHLQAYLATLNKEQVKKAVVFSSTWISRHSIELISRALKEKGIDVADESFYVRGKPSAEKLKEAEAFAEKYL